MFSFGSKKYKKKLEQYEREIAEKNETIEQKNIELDEMKKHFETYKNRMDARLIKKEEIIRKLGERWDILEKNLTRREEELSGRLDEMNNTQIKLINGLKRENGFKTNTIEKQEEYIEKQKVKIKSHEDDLDSAKKEIESLKEDLYLREDIIRNYLVETKGLKEHIENLEKEISKLNMKINDSEHELEHKKSDIKHLQSELRSQKEQNRELEKDLTDLTNNQSKLEAEKKEETESLRSVIEALNKEVQKNTQLLHNIEQGLEEANNQNVSFQEELEEINKLITIYSHEILSKESRLKELQLHNDNFNRDIITKVELIETLELQNKVLEREHEEKLKEHSVEKQKLEKSLAKLCEEILENERNLKIRDEINGKLEVKLKDLEETAKDIELKYEKELQISQNQFLNMVHSKNMIIDSLEGSEKRALQKLAQTNETLKHLENEMERTELHISNTEKQIDELKRKIEDISKRNHVLQYKLKESESSKNEELDKIETIIKDQVKLVNEAYQKEREINKLRVNEFMRDLELAIRKQIGDLENSLKIIDGMQQTIDHFVNSTNKKIETYTLKIKEDEIHRESLKKLVVEKENQNRAMKEQLVQKDNICDNLKKQMDGNLKLLQTEILKSEIELTLTVLGGESNNDESKAPTMERILRQIHTRNVIMKELREDIHSKHHALIRIQEKYQKLSEKIKRVVITVTNAKFDYQELERDNKSLRQSVERKQICDTVEDETRIRETKSQNPLETFSDHDIHVAKAIAVTSTQHDNQHCPSTPPLHVIREELKSIRDKSRKHILKLGLHTGLQKDIELLKAEVQRERKLRKRQEAMFSSLLNTLKAASACSQPDDTDNGDASLEE